MLVLAYLSVPENDSPIASTWDWVQSHSVRSSPNYRLRGVLRTEGTGSGLPSVPTSLEIKWASRTEGLGFPQLPKEKGAGP